jgi:hypothetical protein
MKDGTVLDDISGVVVSAEQFPMIYELLDRMTGDNEIEKLGSNGNSGVLN